MESTEENGKRPNRRNSILKDVVLSENLAEEKLSEKSFLSRRSFKKRVSFADTTSIKEFLAIKDAKTEWNCTYEEPVVHDTSSLSEVNKSICQPTISQNCAASFQAETNTDTQNDVESLETSKTRSEKEEVFEVSEYLMNFLGMKPQTSVVENEENINKESNNDVSLEQMSDKDTRQLTGSRTSTTSADIELLCQVDKPNIDLDSMKTFQNTPAIRATELLIDGEVFNRTLLDDSIIYNKESPMESTRLGNLKCTMMNTFGMAITNCDLEQNIFKDVALMKGDISQFHIKSFGLPCSNEIDKFSSSQYNALPSVNVSQHAVTVMSNDDMEMTTGVLKPFQIIIPDTDMDISNKNLVDQSAMTSEKLSQGLRTLITDEKVSVLCNLPEALIINEINKHVECPHRKPLIAVENVLVNDPNLQIQDVAELFNDGMDFTCKGPPLKKVLHSNLTANENQVEEALYAKKNLSVTCANQQLTKDEFYNDDMEFTCKGVSSKKGLHSNFPAEKCQFEETIYTNENISMTCANQQLLKAKDYDDDMEFTCKGVPFKKVLYPSLPAEEHCIENTIYTNENISMTCTNQQLLEDEDHNDDVEFTCKGAPIKKVLHSNITAEKHQIEETMHTNDNIAMTCADQQLLKDDEMVFICKEAPLKKCLHSSLPAEILQVDENISLACAKQPLLNAKNYDDNMKFTCKGVPFKKVLHPNLPTGEQHIKKNIFTNKNMALIFTDPQLQKTKAYNQDMEIRCHESAHLEATSCSFKKNFTMHLDNICKSNLNMELTHGGELRYEEARNNNNYQTLFKVSFGDKPPTNDRLITSSKLPEEKSSEESGSTYPEISDTMAKLTENIECTSTEEMKLTLSAAKHDWGDCVNETSSGLSSLESLHLDQYKAAIERPQSVILPFPNNNEFTSRSFSEMDSENEIILKASLSNENIPSSSGSSTEFELQCHEKQTVQQKSILKPTVISLQTDPHKESLPLKSCLDLKHPETFEPTTLIEKLTDNNFTREINVFSDLTCNFRSYKDSVFTSPVVQGSGIEVTSKCLSDVDIGETNVSRSQHDESKNSSNENGVFFNYEQSLNSSSPIPDVDESVHLHLQHTLEDLLTSPITNRQNLSMSVSLFCENLALVNSNLYSSSSVSAIKKTVAPEAKTLFGKCEEIANYLPSVHTDKYRHKRLNQSSHCDEPNAKIIAIKNYGARTLPVFSSKNLSFQSCVSNSGKDSTQLMFKSVQENSSVEHNRCHQSSQLVGIASECEEEMLDDIAMDLVDEETPFSSEKIRIDKAQLKINELLKKINEFPDLHPPYISDIVLESFSSALPDFLLPLKDVSKHLLEDLSHYDCEELNSELSAFSTQLTNRIHKVADFNELKKNIINAGLPCNDKNLQPIINSDKFNNICGLCSLESLLESKEISTAMRYKFILDGFKNGCLEMQLQNHPFRIFLDLNHQNNHCTVVRARWQPQLEDLKKSSARLAMAILGHGITTELEKLMTLTLCKAVGSLDFVVKAYDKVTNLLKEILAAQSFHITSFTNSGMTVTLVNAKAHLKVSVYIELYYDDSKDSSFPIIKATPKVILGNLREKALELEISKVPEGPNKLSRIVKALASFVQQMAPQRL